MPWRGPSVPGEFPTLGYLVWDWIEDHCVIPDGDQAGEPFLLTKEQGRFLVWFYRLRPNAKPVEGKHKPASAFHYNRGGQLVRAQKWGKTPFAGGIVCCEAAGPVVFDGWDADGEPVGRPWATPWIQVTACAEDQTDNTWRALQPMIELGPLAAEIPDTGETRINLPGGGRIDRVSSAHLTRLGQRITFGLQDQSESWTPENRGRKLADTQRRNLAGMGGRFLETANAWNPSDHSVAQQTSEDTAPGVYIDDRDPGPGSIHNKRERRKLLRRAYGDAWYVDLDRIEGELVSLIPRDPAQGERWFLNRKRAEHDAAFDLEKWDALARPDDEIPEGAKVTVGVDGARTEDALAVVVTSIEGAHQQAGGMIWEIDPDVEGHEHPLEEVDGAMAAIFESYDVWRVYIDPHNIERLVERWAGRWGAKTIIEWFTNRPKQIAYAVRHYVRAVGLGDLTHDGDELFRAHIGNARRRKLPRIVDENREQMWTLTKDRPHSPNKIDAAMAGTLSWEARSDAIAAGVLEQKKAERPKMRARSVG